MAKKSFRLQFKNWTSLIGDSVKAWPFLGWRMVLLYFITAGSLFVWTALVGGGAYGVLSGMDIDLQSAMLNFLIGGQLTDNLMGPIIGFGSLYALGAIILMILSQVAFLLLVKNYTKKKKRQNLFGLVFKHSWKYFWRFLGITALILVIIAAFVGVGALLSNLAFGLLPMATADTALIVIMAVLALVAIWLMLRFVFLQTALVEKDASVKKTFSLSWNMVKGNGWGVFFFLFLLMIGVIAIGAVLEYIDTLTGLGFVDPYEGDFESFPVISGIVQYVFITPVVSAFIYLFMLHLIKAKKIS